MAEDPDVVLRLGDHADAFADVYLPPAPVGVTGADEPDRSPLLYALHGGFWRAEYDRRHLRPLAYALSMLGWVVVLPEYARSGGGRAGAPWPLLTSDLRVARDTVPALLAEVAPGRVSADPPVLLGHSAGGQLALWWALDAASAPAELRPRHVLALAPVADVGRADGERLGAGAVRDLVGARVPSDMDVAARLRAGELPTGCRLVVLHGTDDVQVPVAHSLALAADVPALDLRTLSGTDHFALIDPLSPAWSDVAAALPARSSLGE